MSTLRWLVHFKIPEAIPLKGSVPYSHVAEVCDVDIGHLKRILRYCMTNRLFEEELADNVAHTPYSAVLVTAPAARNMVEYGCEETFPASAKLVEAHEKWDDSEEPDQTAYNLAHHTKLPMFEHIAQYESRSQRQAQLMRTLGQTPGHELKHTVSGYDWNSVEGVVVDVGGSTGETAIALARAHPHLRIIVEDLPHIVAEGEKNLPPELKDRIRFLGHNFFEPQPEVVLRAEKYLLRMVLHDHSGTHHHTSSQIRKYSNLI